MRNNTIVLFLIALLYSCNSLHHKNTYGSKQVFVSNILPINLDSICNENNDPVLSLKVYNKNKEYGHVVGDYNHISLLIDSGFLEKRNTNKKQPLCNTELNFIKTGWDGLIYNSFNPVLLQKQELDSFKGIPNYLTYVSKEKPYVLNPSIPKHTQYLIIAKEYTLNRIYSYNFYQGVFVLNNNIIE